MITALFPRNARSRAREARFALVCAFWCAFAFLSSRERRIVIIADAIKVRGSEGSCREVQGEVRHVI
jgi:hypothetical protein